MLGKSKHNHDNSEMTLELCEPCYSYGMLMINGSPAGLWCVFTSFYCLKEDNEVFLQMLTETSLQVWEHHGTKPKAGVLFNGRQEGQAWVEQRWELPPIEIKWELTSRKARKKPWKWRQIIYACWVREERPVQYLLLPTLQAKHDDPVRQKWELSSAVTCSTQIMYWGSWIHSCYGKFLLISGKQKVMWARRRLIRFWEILCICCMSRNLKSHTRSLKWQKSVFHLWLDRY